MLPLAALALLTVARETPAATDQDSVAYATVAPYAAPARSMRIERFGGVIELPSSALTPSGFRLPYREGWGPVDSAGSGLIPWNEIRRVQIHGNAVLRGAAFGCALGLICGAVVVAISNSVSEGLPGKGSTDEGQSARGILYAGLGGAAGGAILGASLRRWQTIYRAPGY